MRRQERQIAGNNRALQPPTGLRQSRLPCRTLTTPGVWDSFAAKLFAPHSRLSDSVARVTGHAPRLARFEIPIRFHGRLSRALFPEDRRHFTRLLFSNEAGLLRPPDWRWAAVLPFDARRKNQHGVPHRHLLWRQILSGFQILSLLIVARQTFNRLAHLIRIVLCY